MFKLITRTGALFLFFILIGCIDDQQYKHIRSENKQTHRSLKEAYQSFFPIGFGVHLRDIQADTGLFIAKHFNSISTATAFKFEVIHPHSDEYNWAAADSIVSYGESHNLKVRGHTLVWGARNPYWLFWDKKGDLVNRHLLAERLKEHINKVMNRYKGKVYAWDVVNEAVYDNNKEFLKNNTWYKIMGEEYVVKAFEYAHHADSTALLFYNDYDAEVPDKLKRIVRLIQMIREKNIPVHGIGMQAHWTLSKPSVDDIEDAIKTYAKLGLQVQITELTITNELAISKSLPADTGAITLRYKEVFEIFRKYKELITGVTFWQSDNPAEPYSPPFSKKLEPTATFNELMNW